MPKNFKALQAKMSPEARARSEDKANQMIREMALDELREALDLTQQHLAELLHVKQAAISKVERRSDVYQHASEDHRGHGRATGYPRHPSRWHCPHQPI